jgi:hypothetical protein
VLKVNKTARVSDSRGFQRMFAPGRLTLGVFFPIEAFQRDEPTMRDQGRLARRAEELGFTALWTRDVPLRDPNFGDIGQVYDPWVWLGWIAAQTRTIALATGSIILPLRPPAAHRQGSGFGRPAHRRPARARRCVRRPAGRVPGVRRRCQCPG